MADDVQRPGESAGPAAALVVVDDKLFGAGITQPGKQGVECVFRRQAVDVLLEAGRDYELEGDNERLPDAVRFGYGNSGLGGPALVRGHHWYPESDNPLAHEPTFPWISSISR